MRDILRAAGTATVLSASQAAEVWKPDNGATTSTDGVDIAELCDCTLVDNEAIVLLASSCAKLDEAIEGLLVALVQALKNFCLKINWFPGKSECMILYRGHKAEQSFEVRRVEGKVPVALPSGCDSRYLSVVSKYKHVGSITSLDGSPVHDAQLRATSAMQVAVPFLINLLDLNTFASGLKSTFSEPLTCRNCCSKFKSRFRFRNL